MAKANLTVDIQERWCCGLLTRLFMLAIRLGMNEDKAVALLLKYGFKLVTK